jgi:hypothetical protein
MLSFRQFLIFEQLNGVYLKPSHTHEASLSHTFEIHHPDHGKLGDIHINSTHWSGEPGVSEIVPMQHAKTAAITVDTEHNQKVPRSEILHHTGNGPQYNVGASGTRKLLHHFAQHYPKLERIEGDRMTGARKHNGTDAQAVVHLDRFRNQASR